MLFRSQAQNQIDARVKAARVRMMANAEKFFMAMPSLLEEETAGVVL